MTRQLGAQIGINAYVRSGPDTPPPPVCINLLFQVPPPPLTCVRTLWMPPKLNEPQEIDRKPR